ncbi:MAG: AAA family ATPase [Hormoscilla sp. GUM202]|nr:AAA family ATPase [Hormoscilla sp. GUM202]
MIEKLRLERFKNFQDAELILGPFTLLVGSNASGKSNLREAFRFLHGMARGDRLTSVWRGIRGGGREIAFCGASTFALAVDFTIKDEQAERKATYRIEIDPGIDGKESRVLSERLTFWAPEEAIFTSTMPVKDDPDSLGFIVEYAGDRSQPYRGSNKYSLLSQVVSDVQISPQCRQIASRAISALGMMRFIDFHPEAMGMPSVPGQTTLGDKGENLSSIFQAICQKPEMKEALIQWFQALTPMTVTDLEFPVDESGRILLTSIEENGHKTSIDSFSDGTLRCLAMVAALLGPQPANFYFFEELELSIHPTCLHLPIQLIERQVIKRNIQVVGTTQSSQLIRLLNWRSWEYSSVTYRLPDRFDAQIQRIIDIPDAKRLMDKYNLARLHESGWLENTMYFLADEETED